MSKSAKKQKERERAQAAERERAQAAERAAAQGAGPEAAGTPAPAAAPTAPKPVAPKPPAPPKRPAAGADQAQPPMSPKAAGATAVDEALFEQVAEAAMLAGEPREEGEAQAWLYNGDTLSIKYVEEGEGTPRRLMVAAFRQGVVFQVEGDRQVVLRAGDWVAALPGAEDPLNSA